MKFLKQSKNIPFARFHGQDAELGAPVNWDADQNGPCHALPVCYRDGCVVSQWRPTFKQRLAILFGHNIWLWVYAAQPPVMLQTAPGSTVHEDRPALTWIGR